MFYLLENNRIIDSNTLFTKNIPLWEVKDNLLFAKSKNGKLIKPYKYNAIKNQSENVFDLIEMGDCYLYQNQNMFRPEILLINDKVMFSIFGSRAIKQPQHIYAIYKPDDKGNYIKVWEREEEDETCNGTD